MFFFVRGSAVSPSDRPLPSFVAQRTNERTKKTGMAINFSIECAAFEFLWYYLVGYVVSRRRRQQRKRGVCGYSVRERNALERQINCGDAPKILYGFFLVLVVFAFARARTLSRIDSEKWLGRWAQSKWPGNKQQQQKTNIV